MRFEEVIIELSYNCNLSCTMCGFGKHVNPFDKNKFLSFDNYKEILAQIGGLSKAIRLNGRGESTIHPDFKEILTYTKERFPELNINLFSNFSFGNDSILQSLIENNVQLFISMDSSDEEKLISIRRGARFDHITNNIKRLRPLEKRPFIIFTIQEENLDDLWGIAEFSFKNHCHILFNTIRRDEGLEVFVDLVKNNRDTIKDQFNQVARLYEGTDLQCYLPDQLAGIQLSVAHAKQTHGSMNNCPILDKELCILYDGTVTPCNMFNPYVYGNIREQSLNEIWEGKRRQDFLTAHQYHYYCNNCANLGM